MTLSHYAITYAPSLASHVSEYVTVSAIAGSLSEAVHIADRSVPGGHVVIGITGASGPGVGRHASACRAYEAAGGAA